MAKVGWLKLHRKITEWEYFTNPECVQLLVYLLCQADEEGNVFTTVERICADLRLTRQVVRDRLKKMSSTNTSTIKSTINGTYITLCNFTSYNGKKNEVNHQTNHQTNQPEKEKVSPIPPIKENIQENISSTTTACAHEEFIELLKTDRTWGEVIAMRYSLGSLAELDDWINKFSLDVVCRDTRHKNLQDAKRHFCDWLRINLREKNNGQRNNPKSKAEHIASERERIMREVASAAPRECDAPSWLD